MKRNFLHVPGFITMLGMRVLMALMMPLAAGAADKQAIHGHVPAALARLQAVDRLPGSTHLDLAIGLRLRNTEALTNLLREVYNPSSPLYHRFLTPEQFTARFGPTETDYQAVIAHAKANGFAVSGLHSNRMIVDVNGAVADLEQTFHMTMRVYPHPAEARTFYAPDAEPLVDLQLPVAHISGLDNFTTPHPMNLRAKALEKSMTATPRAGSGPSGSFIGNDFRAAYAPGVTLTGSGQKVGYQVQYTTDLNAGVWNNLGDVATAAVDTLTVSDVIGQDPQRLYRVILSP